MKILAVNHELKFSCPEGFHWMDAEEVRKRNVYGDGEHECLSDPERHMMISIGWKTLKGFAAMLSSAADAARVMEKEISRPMQPFGYRLVNKKETLLDGEKALGFCYEYEAQEIEMVGESLACRRNKTIYYLHVYYRKALQEESRAVWEEIFSSMRWI